MKYVVFLIDGMADYPLEELGGKTPLEAAKTPVMDAMAGNAVFGTFLTLPAGYPTSSDVANMSVLGWDLSKCHTGRGAIESYGMGIPLDRDTVAFRLNLVTVTSGGILEDYSAGHISSPEAKDIIDSLEKEFGCDNIEFKPGMSYRNLLYLKGSEFSPDILYDKPDSCQGRMWEEILPRSDGPGTKHTADTLIDLIYAARELLKDHPVNKKRVSEGKNPANLIWPWSGGKKPDMPPFLELFGRSGGIISAVDVILGLGRLGGMETIRPEGATGFIDTNYENKAKAAVEILKRNDFVYVHIEAADECSHLGDLENKIKAIENCDERLIGTFFIEFKKSIGGEVRAAVLPDHPVPVKLREHTRDEVPFMISGPGIVPDMAIKKYCERECKKGKYTHLKGREFMDLLFSNKIG